MKSVFLPVDGAGKVKSGFRQRHIPDLVTHSALPLQLGKTLAAQACPGKLLYAKEPAICGWVIDIPQWIYPIRPPSYSASTNAWMGPQFSQGKICARPESIPNCQSIAETSFDLSAQSPPHSNTSIGVGPSEDIRKKRSFFVKP